MEVFGYLDRVRMRNEVLCQELEEVPEDDALSLDLV